MSLSIPFSYDYSQHIHSDACSCSSRCQFTEFLVGSRERHLASTAVCVRVFYFHRFSSGISGGRNRGGTNQRIQVHLQTVVKMLLAVVVLVVSMSMSLVVHNCKAPMCCVGGGNWWANNISANTTLCYAFVICSLNIAGRVMVTQHTMYYTVSSALC